MVVALIAILEFSLLEGSQLYVTLVRLGGMLSKPQQCVVLLGRGSLLRMGTAKSRRESPYPNGQIKARHVGLVGKTAHKGAAKYGQLWALYGLKQFGDGCYMALSVESPS